MRLLALELHQALALALVPLSAWRLVQVQLRPRLCPLLPRLLQLLVLVRLLLSAQESILLLPQLPVSAQRRLLV